MSSTPTLTGSAIIQTLNTGIPCPLPGKAFVESVEGKAVKTCHDRSITKSKK